MNIDIPLVVILLLLVVTVVLFVVDIFPYPFGVIILAIMFAGRVMTIGLKNK